MQATQWRPASSFSFRSRAQEPRASTPFRSRAAILAGGRQKRRFPPPIMAGSRQRLCNRYGTGLWQQRLEIEGGVSGLLWAHGDARRAQPARDHVVRGAIERLTHASYRAP